MARPPLPFPLRTTGSSTATGTAGGALKPAEKRVARREPKREGPGKLLPEQVCLGYMKAHRGGGRGSRGNSASNAERGRMRGSWCLFLHPHDKERRGVRGAGGTKAAPGLGAAPEPRANPHQANESEAAVPIDEDLARLPVALEEALEIFLGDISRQIPHEQPAALRVALLAGFEKAFDIDGEPTLLLFISPFFARHYRHGRR